MNKDELKKNIVNLLSNSDMHGYKIQKRLEAKGTKLHLSYIYRILAEMEQEGFIGKKNVKSSFGPNKKIYFLRPKGSKTLDLELARAIKTIHSRYMRYLSSLPPEKSAILELHRLLNKQVKKEDANFLVVAPRSFYDWIISPLCETFKKGKIYLIKSASVEVPTKYANLVVLDSSVEDIFLKDDFVDVVRVHGEPENMDLALKELCRVLKKKGSLAMVLPYYRFREDRPFLTIGEYVEKMEHALSRKSDESLDHDAAKSKLSDYFQRVEDLRLAHLSVFFAYDKKWE